MGRRVWNWREIQRYHDEGHSFVECQRHFGFSHTAWIKAIKRGELRTHEAAFHDRRRRYDWAAVQAYYDAGHSYRECKAHFGFCAEAWTKAVNRGEMKARARSQPLSLLLKTARCRSAVRRRLLSEGVLKNVCAICRLEEWQGKPLTMHIDHINGVSDDHRLENLRMLCPNCHSQTETYGGRNMKRRRRLQDEGAPV